MSENDEFGYPFWTEPDGGDFGKIDTSMRPPAMSSQDKIAEECDAIRDMLLEKNRRYGDSALTPKRIFSKASPVEQILVRIDDKLSRIANVDLSEDEDVLLDLIGYLILLKVASQ